MRVGIEAINIYAGNAVLDVRMLAGSRGLDLERFENLLMKKKTVSLNFEDPISFAVNAARPIIEQLTEEERNRIELLIVCTESGIDFGKAMSSYVHHYLGLKRRCRTFEIKHACYAGTAGLQMAASFVLSGSAPKATALVITTDVARPIPHTYAEPSQGAAAVAMLVSNNPVVLALDIGANGYYGYEVMDSCRPAPDIETGDADLSLLTYLDCLENSYRAYCERVGELDFREHFSFFAFHTPFGAMAKGAHRTLMRKLERQPPHVIEEDFRTRLAPSLIYCQQVGNVYSGSLFVALAGIIEHGDYSTPARIGLFSYGSGCCSEFYSGMADGDSRRAVSATQTGARLAARYELSMDEYERLIEKNRRLMFGGERVEIDRQAFDRIYQSHYAGRGLLVLDHIDAYHRIYRWT
jgi:3-carboxymethyl-3-hydroxy-acyl-[acp] synthase